MKKISLLTTCSWEVVGGTSSGAGKVEHFSKVFEKTDVEAALAAGIFQGKMCTLRKPFPMTWEGPSLFMSETVFFKISTPLPDKH